MRHSDLILKPDLVRSPLVFCYYVSLATADRESRGGRERKEHDCLIEGIQQHSDEMIANLKPRYDKIL